MQILNKSISTKILSILAGIIIISFSLLTFQVSKENASVIHDMEYRYESDITALYKTVTYSSFRFKKGEKIIESFSGLLESKDSKIANITAFDANGNLLGEYNSDKHSSFDLKTYYSELDKEQELISYAAPEHNIIVNRIANIDKGTLYGHLLIAWSTANEKEIINRQIGNLTIISLSIAVSIIALLAFAMKKYVIGPMVNVKAVMAKLADGKLETDIPYQSRQDEIGKMAETLTVFKNNSLETIRLQEQQNEQKELAEKDKRLAMQNLADEFDNSVGTLLSQVLQAVEDINSNATMLQNGATEINKSSIDIKNSSETSSANTQAISAAAEQLSSSVQEISQQVANTQNIASEAVEKSNEAVTVIHELKDNASDIQNVVNLISEIAEQTNLLALNATIESARAGDAGKGFAVVAGEVKALANETAKATSEIADKLASILSNVEKSASSIENVNTVIGRIDEYATSIHAATEEQAVTSSEVSSRINETANSVSAVDRSISGVTAQTEENSSQTAELLNTASVLSNKFKELENKAHEFSSRVRNG